MANPNIKAIWRDRYFGYLLGQYKARPFSFQPVCLFVSWFFCLFDSFSTPIHLDSIAVSVPATLSLWNEASKTGYNTPCTVRAMGATTIHCAMTLTFDLSWPSYSSITPQKWHPKPPYILLPTFARKCLSYILFWIWIWLSLSFQQHSTDWTVSVPGYNWLSLNCSQEKS